MKLIVLAAISLGIVMLSQAMPYGGGGGFYGGGGVGNGAFVHYNEIDNERRNEIGVPPFYNMGNTGIKGHGAFNNPGGPIYPINPGGPIFPQNHEFAYGQEEFHGVFNQNEGFTAHGESNANFINQGHRAPSHPPGYYDRDLGGGRTHSHPPGYFDRDNGIAEPTPPHRLVPDGGLGNPSRGLSPGIYDGAYNNHRQGGSLVGHGHSITTGSTYARSPGIYNHAPNNDGYDNPSGHIGGNHLLPHGGSGGGGYGVKGY